jgi:hypothetical protein
MKDFQGGTFPLSPGMVLFYDKRNNAFMAGASLMDTLYWHNGQSDADDKMFFEQTLSVGDAMSIAQIAANIAGLEIQTEDIGHVIKFTLRSPL